jgi:hypothetical protein
MLEMMELKPCPFCGADARMKWELDDVGGKAIRVSCSRDGGCPSPEWSEVCDEHEDDVACLGSVAGFWNRRAIDWEPGEILRLRVDLAKATQELRVVTFERNKAMMACEQIALGKNMTITNEEE